ncbi:MAG: hypothetical protein Q8O88_03700 [bacterium]|nr:hypothetical protein [bacterium]
MGTRSTISIKTSEDKGQTVYCHWDGYPSNNGKILKEHYNTEEKVKALIKLGDMSSLEASIERPEGHSYDKKVPGHTVFYGRDRGEKKVGPTNFKGMPTRKEEWNYLFQDGEWLVANSDDSFQPLTDTIIKDEKSYSVHLR